MDKMKTEAQDAQSGEMSFQVPLSCIAVRVTPVIWVPGIWRECDQSSERNQLGPIMQLYCAWYLSRL